VWVEDSLAQKLASQFLPTFGGARYGANQTYHFFLSLQEKNTDQGMAQTKHTISSYHFKRKNTDRKEYSASTTQNSSCRQYP
jgi:hypothetical protein